MTVPLTFLLIAGAMAIAVATLLANAILRGQRRARSGATSDLAVYKDQLKEVDRDLARGILTEAEAKQVRVEVSRRILAADRAEDEAEGRQGPKAAAILVTVAVVFGGAGWVYTQIGAPGYPDLPIEERLATAAELRASRPGQADAEARVPPSPALDVDPRLPGLVQQLRDALSDRPDDLQGYVLLANNEALLGDFQAAYAAQSRVLELRGTAADYADYADLLILAAGGYVSPEAEVALNAALDRDPANGSARYYAGLLAIQTGRPDQAFTLWRPLLEEGPPDAPWIAPIRAQIEQAAQAAGVRYTLPAETAAPLRGPSTDDMAAAQEMAPEDRAAMIEGMVAGLADRLANEGGPPEEWAQLINALGVLGRQDEARAIADEAEQVFAGEAVALEIISTARERVGIAE